MTGRVIIIVMDSVGGGYMDDAQKYGDYGSNTLKHVNEACGGLDVPNLCRMGLGRISDLNCSFAPVQGSYGMMREVSPGKDTTSGHWEMAGVKLDFSFPTYPDGFPEEIIKNFEKITKTRVLGNCAASGTAIIDQLGREHMKTGRPIVYTSADSVFQIAAHEEVISLDKLYEMSYAARQILKDEHAVSRVIARPFRGGGQGRFKRNNAGRKDFSLQPPQRTLLDILKEEGLISVGIGKIGDIFAHRGLSEEIKTKGNMDGVDRTLEAIKKYRGQKGLIFTNLVDFDADFGHRRNALGYAKALEEFDSRLPEIIGALSKEDILFITADHGCDPEFKKHTDHTREKVPILAGGEKIKKQVDLGLRESFADCGQTPSDILGVEKLRLGVSFKEDILQYGGKII